MTSQITYRYTAESLAQIADLFEERAGFADFTVKHASTQKEARKAQTQADVWREAAAILRRTKLDPDGGRRLPI